MKRLTGSVIVPLLGALTLAACGESDQDQVRSVVQSFLVDGDPAACERMTSEFVDRIWNGSKNCKTSLEQSDELGRADIGKVVVHGDKATARAVASTGVRLEYKFVKQDGEWALSGGGAVSHQPAKIPAWRRPTIQKGLSPKGTVQAYYGAIKDGDGAVLCGLLSRHYASEIRGGNSSPDVLSDCVQALKSYDWSKPRKQARGVRVVRVSRSGGEASVTLSNGKRALLKNRGRWVIDGIENK
jgi:hypothetical protein